MLADYFWFRILSHVFWYFSTDYPGCVSLYSWPIFLILDFFIKVLLGVVWRRKLTIFHPVSRLYQFEFLLDVVIKLLIKSQSFISLLYSLLIYFCHQIIHKLHNFIVIIPVFPILETITIIWVKKHIIFQSLNVVNFFDLAFKCLINYLSLCHWVLRKQIRSNTILNVIIYKPDLLRR